jgi:hypothetical protein
VELEWSVEEQPLGTGGALKLAAAFVDGPVLVVNGDTLIEGNPWELERDRWEHGALGSVALYEVADAKSRGRVELDAAGSVARFIEKDDRWTGPAWVNGGADVFAPALWRHLPEGASSPSATCCRGSPRAGCCADGARRDGSGTSARPRTGSGPSGRSRDEPGDPLLPRTRPAPAVVLRRRHRRVAVSRGARRLRPVRHDQSLRIRVAAAAPRPAADAGLADSTWWPSTSTRAA